MTLPNHDLVQVPREKITEYLLNPDHRGGKHHPMFVLQLRFWAAEWEVLTLVLLRHVPEHCGGEELRVQDLASTSRSRG